MGIAQANHSKPRAFILEFLLVCAQLRDVLTAENSTVMTQKNQNGGTVRPKGTKLHTFSVDVRQRNARQPAAVCIVHWETFSDDEESCVKSRAGSP